MSPNVKIYVVPHSHIDLEWYWTAENLKDMLPELFTDSMLKVMKRDSEMTFAQDQSFLINMLMENADSDSNELIRKLIGENRLELVGGTYVQPELESPCGESLITQIEAGQKYLKDTFGKTALTAWFIDSFGQINQLPQILNQFGFKGYVFMRDVDKESNPDEFPTDFVYEGPDQSRILTHWLKDTYVLCENPNRELSLKFSTVAVDENNEVSELKKLFDREIGETSVASRTGIALMLWGDDLYSLNADADSIRQSIITAAFKAGRKIKPEDIIFATPSEYFRELEKCSQVLPVKREELSTPFNIQDLRGTYISRIHHKIENRNIENELISLEILSALVNRPLTDRNEYWKPVLYNQFHDLMGGSCLDESYEAVLSRYEEVKRSIGAAYDELLANAGGNARIPGSSGDDNICLYNPTQFEREEPVNIGDDTYTVIHMNPFEIRTVNVSDPASTDQSSANTRIENEYYRIDFCKESGDIVSIYDKTLSEDIGGDVINHIRFSEERDPDMEGELRLTGKEIFEENRADDFRITKNGLSEKVSCTKLIDSFEIIKHVSLTSGVKRIDFELEVVDYPGSDGIISADFSFNKTNQQSLYETPFAVSSGGSGLCCAQRWAGLSGDSYMASVLNKGTCGYLIEGNRISIALLRGFKNYTLYRTYGTERKLEIFQDGKTHTENAAERGYHRFEYALVSTKPGDIFATTREAVLYNNPIKAFGKKAEGRCANTGRNPEKDNPQPFIKNISGKFAVSRMYCDVADKLILRGYNPGPDGGKVIIEFAEVPKSVIETDLKGNLIKEYPADKLLEFSAGPFKIVTFEITRKERTDDRC